MSKLAVVLIVAFCPVLAQAGKGTETLIGTSCGILGRNTSDVRSWVKQPAADDEYGMRGVSPPGYNPLRFDDALAYKSLKWALPRNPDPEAKRRRAAYDPECDDKIDELVKQASDEWAKSYSAYMAGQLQIDDTAEMQIRQSCAGTIENGSRTMQGILDEANAIYADYRRRQVNGTANWESQLDYVKRRDAVEARGSLPVGSNFYQSEIGTGCSALIQCMRPGLKEAQTQLDFYRLERQGKLAATHAERSGALQKQVDGLFSQGGVCPNRRAASLVGVTGTSVAGGESAGQIAR